MLIMLSSRMIARHGVLATMLMDRWVHAMHEAGDRTGKRNDCHKHEQAAIPAWLRRPMPNDCRDAPHELITHDDTRYWTQQSQNVLHKIRTAHLYHELLYPTIGCGIDYPPRSLDVQIRPCVRGGDCSCTTDGVSARTR